MSNYLRAIGGMTPEQLVPAVHELADVIRHKGTPTIVITTLVRRIHSEMPDRTHNLSNTPGPEISSKDQAIYLKCLIGRVEMLTDEHNLAASTELKKDVNQIRKFLRHMEGSATTDDLTKKTPSHPLRRTHSTPDIRKLRTEEAQELPKLREKDSAFWICISRRRDEFGGYIYTFKLREEFDLDHSSDIAKTIADLTEKEAEIFPATEPTTTREVRFLLERTDPALGYSTSTTDSGDLLVHLPDQEALTARWTNMKMLRPDLPDLDIASGDGIADDIEFVIAYLSHDFLLSTGKEFFHDSLVHGVYTVRSLSKSSSDIHKKRKFELARALLSSYRKIELIKKELEPIDARNAKKQNAGKKIWTPEEINDLQHGIQMIELCLGIVADLLSAGNQISPSPQFLANPARSDFAGGQYAGLWERRFTGEDYSYGRVQKLLEQMTAFEKNYDEEHMRRRY